MFSRSAFAIFPFLVASLSLTGRSDFLLTAGNAAFNPSFTLPSWGSTLSNSTRPYQWNSSSSAQNTEGSLYAGVPGSLTDSNLGASAVRSYRWGFRNAGGEINGTAGKGLSGTSGGITSYTQTYTTGSNSGRIDWLDSFESPRSRVNASLVYTLTDGDGAGTSAALVRVDATFTNRATTTETYDFLNIVDSQILGTGNGTNDTVSVSVDGTFHTLRFSDTISGQPYELNFIGENPTFWEANSLASIANKAASGNASSPTNFSGVNGSISNVITGTGDLAGGFQWRVTLAPNESITLTSHIGLNMTAVPEPNSMLLLGLCFAGLVPFRQRLVWSFG
jgi:hypothetical protein